MAKQKGVIPLPGIPDSISFYESEGEYRARGKTGPSRKTVLTSTRFARTRENATEFRRATRATKLVRLCLHHLVKTLRLADSQATGRLIALCLKIVQSDPVSDRGQRMISNGELEMLEDFAFHKEHLLSNIFPVGPVSSINSTAGRLKTEIRSFDPQQRVHAPAGATHFQVVSIAGAIDFEAETWNSDHQETGYLSLDERTDAICLEHVLPPKAGQSLLLAMGVVFYARGEDGCYKRVKGGAMRVLQVSGLEFGVLGCSAGRVEDETVTAQNVPVRGNTNRGDG
jgi:hypothetical protein